MKRRTGLLLGVAIALAAGSTSTLAQVAVDTGWTYQGRLTDSGTPATGSYDLRFSLFLDDQGTIPTGPVLDAPGVAVAAGLFTTRLDFGGQFTGYKNWLQVEVSPAGAGTYTALPLQEITSAPQSIFAQSAVIAQSLGLPYSAAADVAGPNAVFSIDNVDVANGTALWGQSEGTQGTGVYGLGASTTGFNFGGLFETNSPDGRAVRAVNNATTGLAVAGRFATGAPTGISIWSTATATTGANFGIYGDSLSTDGVGVYGRASATSGSTYAVSGENYSVNGAGVHGIGLTSTGFNFGGFFESNSPDGRAVRAVNNATSGQAVAARIATGSPAGLSIWSTASASSGVNYGIYADTNSVSGFGGYFRNNAGGTALFADGLAKVKTLQILGGADLAEPFDVAPGSAGSIAEPGMVVVIDAAHPGDLRLADQPYDGKVAGVISGANGLSPGMVMSAQGQDKADGKQPVAMTGRVWVYVDASFGAVQPGDLLTTSATPGHAMLASDHGRAFGAVIGKAMTELKEGKGLVLVLVSLQ